MTSAWEYVREHLWELGGVLLAIIAFLSLLVAAYFAVDNHTLTQRYHAASVAKQDQIIELQQRNHALGISNNRLAREIIKDSKTVAADGKLVYEQNAAVCTALHISPCPGAP